MGQPIDISDDHAQPITTISPAVIKVTNDRYQANPFWAGPKGLAYGLLLGHQEWQVANAYPDANCTYFVAQFILPPHALIKLSGYYGHARYFSYTIANNLGNNVQGGGTFLRDEEILPDDDSINPFLSTNPRNVGEDQRRYTIYIHPGNPCQGSDKANTLYTGTVEPEPKAHSHLALRTYLPDAGYDGLGIATMPGVTGGRHVQDALPTFTVVVRDPMGTGEKSYTGQAAIELLRMKKIPQDQEYGVYEWIGRAETSGDPINAPAWKTPSFERFWNMKYSVSGAFIRNQQKRVEQFPPNDDGAWLTNPDTVYQVGIFSLRHGEVVVIKGKMPSFPSTRRGNINWPSEQPELRYWSLTTGGTAPSGLGWATVYDEEIPLNKYREYTVVMSRAIDRPCNATRKNGVMWIEFGDGEGYFIGARNWVNSVYIRFQASAKKWIQSPNHIPIPTVDKPNPKDPDVMGKYYPMAEYTTKALFEDTFTGMPISSESSNP